MYRSVIYPIIVLIAVAVTFLVHEFTHWLTGEFLGYDMIMTLNTTYPSNEYERPWHYTLVSATGPLVTLAQAMLTALLIRRYHRDFLYPFLFTPFCIEILSGVMNLKNPNDLGRIGQALHLGLLTLPICFIVIQTSIVDLTSKQENYSRRFNIITLLWVIFFSSIWILSNQFFNIILIDK